LGILEQECSRREQELITINDNSEAHNETELLEQIDLEDLNNNENSYEREIVEGENSQREIVGGSNQERFGNLLRQRDEMLGEMRQT
jgi:hypothetical protein